MDAIEQFAADESLGALLIYKAGRTFVAGANIAEDCLRGFGLRALHAVLNRIEMLNRPVVSVLQGRPWAEAWNLRWHATIGSPTRRCEQDFQKFSWTCCRAQAVHSVFLG